MNFETFPLYDFKSPISFMEELALSTFLFASIAAFLIGMAKAGLKGIGAIIMTIMALAFGAKASTGIVLLLLLTGDILAVIYYKRSVDLSLIHI